jgi:hypothetical protein
LLVKLELQRQTPEGQLLSQVVLVIQRAPVVPFLFLVVTAEMMRLAVLPLLLAELPVEVTRQVVLLF